MYKNVANFSESQHKDLVHVLQHGTDDERTLGSIEFGRVCVDLVAPASYCNSGSVRMNIYVGGVPTMYATTINGEPYDFIEGFTVFNKDDVKLYEPYEQCIDSICGALLEYCKVSGYQVDGKSLEDFVDTDDSFHWD